jgi:pyridoxine kinase
MINTQRTKRVVAIHDLSGYGRISLTVVIPVLNSMGFNVCPLPTAILSNGTQFSKFSFLDLTDEMTHIIAHWKEMHLEFDAFYSGYLGSPEQIEIVKNFISDFKNGGNLVVIDPVLGDNGTIYNGFDDRIVKEMRKLIKVADIITPNLTELSLLIDEPYKEVNSDDELKILLKMLAAQGPEIVIITNVPVPNNSHLTSVYAYNKRGNRYWKTTCPYIPAHYPGLGDTFTSVITGSLLQGDSLPMALDRATQFCYQGIRATFGHDYDNREGVVLEKVLANLNAPIQVTSCELI